MGILVLLTEKETEAQTGQETILRSRTQSYILRLENRQSFGRRVSSHKLSSFCQNAITSHLVI